VTRRAEAGTGGDEAGDAEGPVPAEDWPRIVEHVPLVSVDLLVRDGDGVVVGKRTNEPAKGEWSGTPDDDQHAGFRAVGWEDGDDESLHPYVRRYLRDARAAGIDGGVGDDGPDADRG